MEEIWKPIHTFKSNSTYHLAGDTYYISNKGGVKLNDEVKLTIGNGLYVDKRTVKIAANINLPERNFYRTIYKLFGSEDIKYGCDSNIHHIDYNRLNNSIDNLVQLSSFEHAHIHANDYKTGKMQINIEVNKQLDRLEKFKYEYIKDWKDFLIQRKEEYFNKQKIEKNKNRLINSEKHKIKKLKEKDELLEFKKNSPDYVSYTTKYGMTIWRKKTSLKKGQKMSDEQKDKIRNAVNKRFEEDVTYRYRCTDWHRKNKLFS